jgi:2-keto-3-deoxy-L-fuconate dehydrogenase
MSGRLAGKVALVTAAGQGIGRASAIAMAREGAQVHATDVRGDLLESLQGVPNLTTRVLDCSEDDWDRSFDINVKSMHRTIKSFLPGMLKKKAGAIVNISSAVSSIRGVPDRYAYGATKAAVIGLTKAVAADFIRRGIRSNAVCPGTIESPSLADRMSTVARERGRALKDVRKSFIERQPIGRLGTAAEVAWFVVFLASDEASYVTGQAYLVDGGMAL